MGKARRLAAVRMLVSGIRHASQLAVHPWQRDGVGAGRTAPWLGAVVPATGGVLGVVHFLRVHASFAAAFAHLGVGGGMQ